MRSIFILTFVIVSFLEVKSQNLTLGLGFGFNMRNNTGVNTVSDSIIVESDGSRSMLNVYSAFMEYKLSEFVQFRSSLNLTDQLNGFTLYNYQDTCLFCPIHKATTIGSVNLNVANELALRIPIMSPIDFFVFGGIRTNFTFTKKEPDISFRNGTKHQGLAEAVNNMDRTIKPVYFNSVIGVKSDWKRFSLILELDKNIGSSITRSLPMYGKKYSFLNRTNIFTLTMNYKIIPWKYSNGY